MKKATQTQADAFARHMCTRFKAPLIHKQGAFGMDWVAKGFDLARALGRTNLPSGNDFLNNTATTIGTFIYLPDGWDPDTQIEVVTHECQHVHQFVSNNYLYLPGGLGMWWLYVTEPEARVQVEADATHAQMEVRYWRTREIPPTLEDLVHPLESGYDLEPRFVDFGKHLLEAKATSVSSGQLNTAAGREAVKWLRENAPELSA